MQMNSESIKAKDKEYVLGVYNRSDLCLTKGKGARAWSPEGKEYIDFSSGIGVNALGFCDDGWVSAITRQLTLIQHTSNLFYTEPCTALAEILCQKTGMSKVFFANSGAEANECVIKAARKYGNQQGKGGRNQIISLVNSFHGRTMAAITATGQDEYHKHFDPFLTGFAYAEVNDLEDFKLKKSDQTCAVIMEMVQGEGGVIKLNEDYVKAVFEICAADDILFITDEVQTGIGRTGKLFAYEHFGIKPDMVTMAKGLGGGLPIGGVLFNEKCSEILRPGEHGTTYGGNPAACAGGLEILKRLDEAFLSEVEKKGNYMKEKLLKMNNVVEISGLGLMIGVKISGKTSKEIMEKSIQNGLILLTAKDKIRIMPPLTITYEEIDSGLEILENMMK